MDDLTDQPEAEELAEQHPRWTVWRSDTRQWWASVRVNLSPHQERAGCAPFLCAGSSVELAELLAKEDERAANVRRGDHTMELGA